MSELTPRDRLLRALRKEPVDRPPVICIGGMMNAAIVDIMTQTGHTLPEAHFDEWRMAELALAVHKSTGFENIGVPFCMTVEAEALGSGIDPGTLACEPKIASEAFASVSEVEFRDIDSLLGNSRTTTVAGAARALSGKYSHMPIVVAVTGPISTAASVVDPMTFLKELRKKGRESHRLLEYITGFLKAYCEKLAASGATVIGIGDPTATGEILGPRIFEEFALPYINDLTDHIQRMGTPVIVHICGKINQVRHLMARLRASALSTDAMVNLRALKEEYPHLTTMGNVSTYVLESGPAEKIERLAERLLRDGIDIVAPACGLSTSTPIENIRVLTNTVKRGHAC
jgi:[methyl-Co(III) methanol-specific corrinoid protein]:coenzyme M methyltransferase